MVKFMLSMTSFCLAGFLFTYNTASAPLVNSIGKIMPADAAPLDQQVFRYFRGEPIHYDISVAIYEAQGALMLFERLTMLNENLDLIPGAAERWEASEDGRQWTFHLRPDAKWSDGRPVTAHDFEYSFKRFLSPEAASAFAFFYYDIKGARPFNQGAVTDPNTVGVRAVDDLTFVIETERPCPYLPYITAFPGSGPVPSWQVEKYGRRWSEAETFVSNSSYTLTEWLKGREATVKLNPYYNGPNKGYVEVIKQIFVNKAPGLPPYENNEVDWLPVDIPDLAYIESDPDLREQLVRYAVPGTWYIFFQTHKPPFNNLKVRQAISHAINREVISNTVLRGSAVPAYTMLPRNFPGNSTDDLKGIQHFDPELARSLLAEAGYPNGRGFPKVDFWIGAASPAIKMLNEAVQSMLKENLNIEVNIVVTDDKMYRDNMFKMTIPMGFGTFSVDYPDPNNLLAQVWHSQEPGFGRQDWRNNAFDRLVDQAAAEMNSDRRMAMYRDAERLLLEDVGGVFLVHPLNLELRKPWLKGIKTNRSGYSYFTWDNSVHLNMYIAEH